VKVVIPLLLHLPETCAYRVVLMRRSLDEVIASQRVMLERAAKRGGRISPEELRRLYEAEWRKAEAWLDATPHVEWLAVSYNGLLAAPELVVRSIAAFLGGGLDQAAMGAAVEPSLYRQRAGSAPAGPLAGGGS
jgi:hypothetical protein